MPDDTKQHRWSLEVAQVVSDRLLEYFRPAFDRLVVAGSVRRQREYVSDIELVGILRPVGFMEPPPLDALMSSLVCSKSGPKYKRFTFCGMPVDLFVATPETWGVQLAIRTGPARFSRLLVTRVLHGGRLPSNLCVRDGRVRHLSNDQTLDTPEEEDFLALAGGWVPPEDRGRVIA